MIKRSPVNDLEWHVYSPRYYGAILLLGGVYRAQPYRRHGDGTPWPVACFSEINLAADYLVEAGR